jgi:hypothetical protein
MFSLKIKINFAEKPAKCVTTPRGQIQIQWATPDRGPKLRVVISNNALVQSVAANTKLSTSTVMVATATHGLLGKIVAAKL